MWIRPGTKVIISLIDGSSIRGRTVRTWRWRVIRLAKAEALTSQGAVPALGPMLIPYRSILLAQVDLDD